MSRAALCVLIAACGGAPPASAPPTTPPPAEPPATPTPLPVPPPGTPLTAAPGTRVVSAAGRRAIEAPHAGAITALAVTPDGQSAVTCDQLGGLRLWPKLDGSKEPVVVDLPHPKQLAIAARADGFTVAVRDDVGGVVIANLDGDGRTRSHATLPTEPAYEGIATTAAGVLAWRADQTIELLGDGGEVKARLPVAAQQRLIDVAVAGGRAAAIVEVHDQGIPLRKVRWIQLAPALAWGAWLPAKLEPGQQLALSPGGTRYATLVHDDKKPGQERALVFDVATGKVIGDQMVGNADDLGMIDEEHVAIASAASLLWLTAKPGEKPALAAPPGAVVGAGLSHALLAATAGRAITSENGDLAFATPTAVSYLGYGIESPTIAQPSADGRLVVGVGDSFVELDRELRATPAKTLTVPTGTTVADVRWLGGDDWAVVASGSDGVTRVDLVDVAHGTTKPVREKLTVVPVVMYQPTSRLLTLSLGDSPEALRYDPARHTLDRVAALPKPKGFEQAELVPLSPALADGAELVRVSVKDKPTISWLKDARQLGKAAASVTVDNASFAGADAAGHVFVWRNTPANTLELAIYTAGKATGTLPNDGPVALWPDPAGKQVIEVGQRAVALYKLDGTRVWIQELAGTTEALWLGDGTIAIVSAAGIARLDAASGAVTAARCGWRFGLSPKPHPATPQIEPVCAQLEH